MRTSQLNGAKCANYMTKGIVITTHIGSPWLMECLSSIKTDYPIVVHLNGGLNRNGWELAGIQKGQDNFDEFIHLMDSTVIKNQSLFDRLFAMEGNVFLTNGGYHYMGKFVSNTLGKLPTADNKEEAIQWELNWYKGPRTYFTPDLPVHTDERLEKHGRTNMVLENAYMVKFKGTFHI